ncbi:hypothetical protein D1007_10695 [Hordeum vulgare]|nr:hypothetical protein D1007_10695 [Hordeum vulgare]
MMNSFVHEKKKAWLLYGRLHETPGMQSTGVSKLVRMFQPDKYPGLDEHYEQKHRAVLVERREVPPLLRLRGHNPNETLLYGPCYEPYFRRMDLLQFVLNFKGTPPWLNATALTALTDRWRPETHSFHLPLGEMSITLEDIAMIIGLPIEGRALTRKVRCPKDASPVVVERFARAYLWNLLTQVVFLDGTGDTASWMFLDPLRDWDVKWSWGSAAVAFLYRQLDGACMRSKPTSSLGGFVWALQKVVNHCRTLAALLSFHGVSSTDVRARAQYTMDVQSSARPSASRPRSSSARPSSSRAHASSSRAHVEAIEEEEESDNEAADPDFIEFGALQMEDAPQPSQPTQPMEETRRASSRNIRHPGWQNTREGYITKGKMAAKRGRK